jgi:hypothetical protein
MFIHTRVTVLKGEKRSQSTGSKTKWGVRRRRVGEQSNPQGERGFVDFLLMVPP